MSVLKLSMSIFYCNFFAVFEKMLSWEKLFTLSLATTDYGRPMKPFFIEIQIFGHGQTNRADKFWSIWGIFGQTISTQFGTVSPLSMFSIIQPLFLKNIFIWDWDLNLGRKNLGIQPSCDRMNLSNFPLKAQTN